MAKAVIGVSNNAGLINLTNLIGSDVILGINQKNTIIT